jgi:hypothetical protein
MRISVIFGAFALVLAACGTGTDTTTTTPPESPITTAPTTTTAPSASVEAFGAIVALASDGTAITVDLAEMLSGEEARQAAVADRVIEEGEDLPNDFYIRSLGVTEDFALAADAVINLQGFDADGSPTPVPVTVAEFVVAYESGFADPTWYGGDYFEIVVAGETVVEATQVYLP